MPAPSRKRKRSGSAAVEAGAADAPRAAARARATTDQAPPDAAPVAAGLNEGMRRGYARGRARDEAIRAGLEPLAPGERPRVVTIAAAIALLLAVGNAATALTGNDIASASGDPSVTSAVTTALLLLVGFGMLAGQYWAVLGFQTMIGVQIVFFSLYLIGVQSVWQGLLTVVAIGLLGTLFWKLVRPMARMQMPRRDADAPSP